MIGFLVIHKRGFSLVRPIWKSRWAETKIISSSSICWAYQVIRGMHHVLHLQARRGKCNVLPSAIWQPFLNIKLKGCLRWKISTRRLTYKCRGKECKICHLCSRIEQTWGQVSKKEVFKDVWIACLILTMNMLMGVMSSMPVCHPLVYTRLWWGNEGAVIRIIYQASWCWLSLARAFPALCLFRWEYARLAGLFWAVNEVSKLPLCKWFRMLAPGVDSALILFQTKIFLELLTCNCKSSIL